MKVIEISEEPSWIKQNWIFLVFIMMLTSIASFEYYKMKGAIHTHIGSSYEGKVSYLYHHKSKVFVTTDKGEKLEIGPSFNYALSPYMFSDFILEGDSISKRSCSDTIYLTRDGMTYDFLMNDYSYNNTSLDKETRAKLLMNRILRHEENGCVMEGVKSK